MQSYRFGKILFQNRPKGSWTGGDMIQLEKTQDALQKLGVDVTFNDQPLYTPALLFSDFDIVHTWNFSMEWTKWQIWAAKKHKRKLVCSMIYHETDAFISYDNQQIMLDACDACIFLSQGEVERVKRNLTIDESKVHIIENGIDPFWFKKVDDENIYGDYVLTVGRVEDSKGQIATAKACKQLGIKYLCAGQIMDQGNAQIVKNNGGILLGNKTPEELRVLYKHAKCVVLASMHEIYPLVVMEAGAQGANIVLTDGSEWKPEGVELCKYNDVDSIKSAISKQMKKKKNTAFIKRLKTMTWENVAKQIIEVYNSI